VRVVQLIEFVLELRDARLQTVDEVVGGWLALDTFGV
jgi:hypothetical protein